MKTKIITLESHDNLISVRDKLSWAKTPRILLVAPKYAKVTLRILDLKALQRHADSLGAQLGLVTRRLKLRRDAESLGIPVFKSAADAQRKEWKAPAPRQQFIPKPPRRDLRSMRDIAHPKEAAWRNSLPGRILAFTFGVAAILAIAIIFIPRARVTLYPEIKNQAVNIPLRASEEQQSASITGALPAQKIFTTVEMEQSLAVSSEIIVPKTKSQGIARFANLTQGGVNIPKGTVLSTVEEPRVRFVTLNDAWFNESNKFLDVNIESQQGGLSANVRADSIKVVEGLLGFSLAVTNPVETSGGSDARDVGASEQDRARLKETMLENLRREAEVQLRAQLAPSDVWIGDTLEMLEILEENFSPEEGQPGRTLTLKMKVIFSARYISAEDWQKVSNAALSASLPGGFATLEGEPSFEFSAPMTDAAGVTHVEMEVSRPIIRAVNRQQISILIRGATPQAVQNELLQHIPMRQQPQVVITPSWWKWMPLIPFNVFVDVK